MFFLLRVAFWLSIVILLLPSGTARQSNESPAAAPGVGAVEALSAVGAAVSDLRQFCSRQPEACVVGSQAAAALGERLQNGAKTLYGFVTERVAEPSVGSIAPKPASRLFNPEPQLSQNTLTPEDRAVPWRGPAASRSQGTKPAS